MNLDQPKRTARIAGLFYLAFGITGAFGIMYIPTSIIEASDPAATAKNILDNEAIYRLSIFSEMISQTIFVFLALTLYRLFRDVDKVNARILVGLVLVSVPIALLATLNQVLPLHLLQEGYLSDVFEAGQIHALAMFFLNLNDDGVAIAQIFWGLWLFPFGLLAIKSGFIVKWIGYSLIAACFGYLASSTAHFLFPGYVLLVAPFTAVLGTVAECSMILWLLIKGVKD